MAAEKLTKHRLAQILITLFVLLVAFFWRTITHTEMRTVECELNPNCSVFVNGQKITVKRDDTNESVIIVYPTSPEWDLKYSGEITSKGNTTTLKPKDNNQETADSLTINEVIEIKISL